MTRTGYDVGSSEYQPRGFYGHLDPEPPPPVAFVRRSRLKSGARLWLAVVVAGIVSIAVRSFVAGLDDPSVGDCVNATGSTSFELVECGTAEAKFRIVGAEEELRTPEELEATPDLCAGFPTAYIYLWEPGHRSTSGTVYCAEML